MSVIGDFLSLVYPRVCVACSATLFGHEEFLCGHCRLNLPKGNFHRRQNHELGYVFAGRLPFVVAASYYTYEKRGRVQRLLHAIKYHGQKELAAFLGNLFASDLKEASALSDLAAIIPVPLHVKKQKLRGFNQSEWFARGLSEQLQVPVDLNVLRRPKETATQTRKRKYARWENVEGIFSLDGGNALAGKHLLLVDDVITTGATIEAAWSTLKGIPDVKLSVASIAFAPRA